jgi:putative MATE family efflux protein
LTEPLDYIDPEVDDPEGGAGLPSAVLAAHAAPVPSKRSEGRQTDRDILALTWPVTLSMALASAVGVIDIAMLGRLGTNALAAVGYAMQFFFLAQAVLMAVGVACVAMMSRAIGAGDVQRARKSFAASLLIAVTTAAVVSTLALLFPEWPMRVLGAPEEIVALAAPYFQLTIGSSLLFAFSFTYENAFRAAKDTRTPMLISAVVTVIKIGLNWLFIFGGFGLPPLDLVGAGLATIGSQLVAAVLFVTASRRLERGSPLRPSRGDFRDLREVGRDTLRLALPGVLERFGMNLALMSYFFILGQYGPVTIAAYTVGVRVLSFSWIPGIGFSTAASTLVGQALGASDPAEAARVGWRSARLAVGVSVILGVGFALARRPLAQLFTDDPAVVDALDPFMLVLALSQPFLGLHFTLGGALRGAGDTVTPLFAALIGNWGFRVPLAFCVAYLLEWDVAWVWFALTFDHIARSTWMVLAFRRGRWADNLGASAF